jgi:hypothetical protein
MSNGRVAIFKPNRPNFHTPKASQLSSKGDHASRQTWLASQRMPSCEPLWYCLAGRCRRNNPFTRLKARTSYCKLADELSASALHMNAPFQLGMSCYFGSDLPIDFGDPDRGVDTPLIERSLDRTFANRPHGTLRRADLAGLVCVAKASRE